MKIHKLNYKKLLTKATAAILSVGLWTTMASAASLGSLAQSSYLTINEGTLLSTAVWMDGNNRQAEQYIEYAPGGPVVPIVAYGSKLYGRSTLDYVAEYLENQDATLVAGVNGDFFEFTTGVSLGVVVNDYFVMATNNARAGIGFKADGTIVMSDPDMNLSVRLGDLYYDEVHLNKELTASSGPVLYTTDYSENNRSTIPSVNVIIATDEPRLFINEPISGTVIDVLDSTEPETIPENCMLLSVAASSAYATDTTASDLKTLVTGRPVTINISSAGSWYDVRFGLGADSWLVNDGQAQPQTGTTADEITARTAVGVKADGTVVFYTVDGKQSGYSTGVTLDTLAQRMVELGCVRALNLDGGGSTVMSVTYPGNESIETISKPSDGAQRKCANYIFLVNTAEPTGETDKLFMYPYSPTILKGATQKFTVKATDSTWHPTEPPIVMSYDGGSLGVMDDFGVFTAQSSGQGEVYVSSRGVTGKAVVTVVDAPDEITLARQSGGSLTEGLTVAPAAEVDLTAGASLAGASIVSSDDCYTWQTTGGVGTIDGNGLFKAAYTDTRLDGTITVSCGNVSASIAVTVSPDLVSGQVVEGFEAAASLPISENTALNATLERDMTLVKYGWSSLKLSYDFAQAGSETPPSARLDIALSGEPTNLAFWIYGDGKGHSLNVITATADGTPDVHTATIDFTGWKYAVIALDEGTTSVRGIGMTRGSGEELSGNLYIDQIISSTGALSDLTGPVITGTVSSGQFTGTIVDAGATKVTTAGVSVTIDGTAAQFTFDQQSGAISLALPTDGAAHRLRITAADSSGNLSSASYEITGTAASPFSDMDGHWANSFTSYLYGQGIISGLTGPNGGLIYDPDSPMNREQFAVIMTNFLKTDLSQYASVELPFADADQISSWALGAVKAAYSLGIIRGDSSGGTLNFKPANSLTRSEAMTIIGRTQQRGYPDASLDQFGDSADVPSWASVFIRPLITQGVVSGSGGMLLPNDSVTRSQVAKMLCTLV